MSLALMIGGTLFGANAAAKTKRQLEAIANTPGLDLSGVYGDYASSVSKSLPGVAKAAGALNQANAANMNAYLDASIPGWTDIQGNRAAMTRDLLAGKIPEDVLNQVRRSAAAKSVAGGYGGSSAGRNLEARDLGLTSLDLMGLGQQYAGNIIGTTPLSFTDLNNQFASGQDVLGLRSNERTERLNMLTSAAIAPSYGQALGTGLQQTGAKFMDVIGSVAGGAAGAMCWVARECLGTENGDWLMFREWLLSMAPEWFRNLYIRHGKAFARRIHKKPWLKKAIAIWMKSRIREWQKQEQEEVWQASA